MERVLDRRVVRGIVLHILNAYQEPSDENEAEIEKVLPLLQSADRLVRDQAAKASRLWMGLKQRCPLHHRRLIFYRLRHLDNALSQLEKMTRPKRKTKCLKSS